MIQTTGPGPAQGGGGRPAAAHRAPSEGAVRRIVTEINVKIRDMMFKPPPGPPLGLKPYDADEVVREWREAREG